MQEFGKVPSMDAGMYAEQKWKDPLKTTQKRSWCNGAKGYMRYPILH